MLGTPEIILVILLLFCERKIPELMKGLGRGIKSFKDGMNGIEKDLNTDVRPKDKTADFTADEKDKTE